MKKIAIAAGLAMTLGFSAAQAQVPGYAANSSDTVWRTSFGECWQTSSWSIDKAVPGCAGYVAQADAPAPAPAPAPDVAGLERKFALYFDFDKTNVKAEFDAKLGTYIEFMKEFGKLGFTIEGHTDAMGSNRYNDGLSLRRSQQVIDYLIREGIETPRLEKSGKGEEEPMAPNEYSDGRDNPQGRALNCRVEFHIQNP